MLILGEKLMNYVTPIESKKHKGFFVVPTTDLILVSKEGKFINNLTGKKVKTVFDKSGYWRIHINAGDHTATFLMHRVLAKTFIKKPENITDKESENLKVLFTDGNHDKNTLDNLEWVTNEVYLQRNYENCISNTKYILSKNILTGQIKRFSNFEQCSNFFNIGIKRLYYHLKSKRAGTITKNWNVFLLEDNSDWPVLKTYQINENSWDGLFGYWYSKSKDYEKTLFNKNLEKLCSITNLSFFEVKAKLGINKKCTHNDWEIWYSDCPLISATPLPMQS